MGFTSQCSPAMTYYFNFSSDYYQVIIIATYSVLVYSRVALESHLLNFDNTVMIGFVSFLIMRN